MITFTRTTRVILVAAAALAVAAPTASAKPFVVAPGGPNVASGGNYQGTHRRRLAGCPRSRRHGEPGDGHPPAPGRYEDRREQQLLRLG